MARPPKSVKSGRKKENKGESEGENEETDGKVNLELCPHCGEMLSTRQISRHLEGKSVPFLTRASQMAKNLKEKTEKLARKVSSTFSRSPTPSSTYTPRSGPMSSPAFFSSPMAISPVVAQSLNSVSMASPILDTETEHPPERRWRTTVEDVPEEDEELDVGATELEEVGLGLPDVAIEEYASEEGEEDDFWGVPEASESEESLGLGYSSDEDYNNYDDDEEFNRLWAAAIAQGGMTLTAEDSSVLRAVMYKLRHCLSDRAFNELPWVFPDQVGLTTLKNSKSQLRFLCDFKPESYHCCINVCVLYVDDYADLTHCPNPKCRHPRYNDNGQPYKIFTYVPAIPRLVALAANPEAEKLMGYRNQHFPPDPNDDIQTPKPKMTDIFDGTNYRRLVKKRVVVDSVRYPHRFFEQKTDIALGFSTDGFCPFRRRKKTCWPLLLFNYNLPPEIRFHAKWAMCLGVIPGPNKPWDSNSFLRPYVNEMKKLAIGVPAFSAQSNSNFKLRGFPIDGFGDIPAISMVLCLKGHNGKCPCRDCKIQGIRDPAAKATTHYVPLARFPPEPPYDPKKLPRRTHAEFIADGKAAQDKTVSAAERERRSKASGIKGLTILSEIPSLFFPDSFPFDFMHLIWENLIKNLVLFWTGSFKDLDHANQDYVIDRTVWDAIAKAGSQAGATIPNAYAARPKDITNDRIATTADTWSFWTLFLAPVFLRRQFKNREYYDHFIELVKIINICLQFEYTLEDIGKIRAGFNDWVLEYERLYFQYELDRLPACPTTIHSLLHIADGIKANGPVWAYWAFAMERYCGRLRPWIKSRRHPWANLDNNVVLAAQADQILHNYNLHSVFDSNSNKESIRDFAIPDDFYAQWYTLASPRVKNPEIEPGVEHKLAAALSTRYTPEGKPAISLRTVRKYFKVKNVQLFGRIKMLHGGDTIRAARLCRTTAKDSREASFVRYELAVDRNAALSYDKADEDLVLETYFGEVQQVFVIKMPRSKELGIKEEEIVVFVEIQPCNTRLNEIDLTMCASRPGKLKGLDIHIYPGMKVGTEIVDLTTIMALIGRFKWEGMWVIIDRSGNVNRPELVHDQLL